MFLSFVFLLSTLVVPSQASVFDDMSDEDFKMLVDVHGEFALKYAESAAKGCVAGGVKDGLKGGLPGLCIGCATGAAAGVAVQMTFPSLPKRDE